MDEAACERVRAAMDRGAIEPAEILGDDISRDADVRRTLVIDVDHETVGGIEARLDGVRPLVSRFYSLPLIAREGPAFLRYQPGGFYRPHRDHGRLASWPGAARRQVALVVFLNGSAEAPTSDRFTGGVLRLLEGPSAPVEIVPEPGTLVAFPARLLHEVAPVRTGIRDTIVDWFY